jgi:hypothetical protein
MSVYNVAQFHSSYLQVLDDAEVVIQLIATDVDTEGAIVDLDFYTKLLMLVFLTRLPSVLRSVAVQWPGRFSAKRPNASYSISLAHGRQCGASGTFACWQVR